MTGFPALAFPFRSPDIGGGGWRWTSHSPTGSGPEGSSPNELRLGSLVSLPLSTTSFRGAKREPESISPMPSVSLSFGGMDSGQPLRALRNDAGPGHDERRHEP